VRVFAEANARADDGMELERFETFDAGSFGALASAAEMNRAIDSMIADLQALRRAPLADPFIGPAILEGRAAGVFFHEIFGHRVEGHRQKNEDEGQTFAKKIGEPVMPAFVSVYDDPTLSRIGGVDLNGFYRFDDEAVTAQRATLVDRGVLTGFLLSRSPTRGFHESNGHGRRQEGRAVSPAPPLPQLVVSVFVSPTAECTGSGSHLPLPSQRCVSCSSASRHDCLHKRNLL